MRKIPPGLTVTAAVPRGVWLLGAEPPTAPLREMKVPWFTVKVLPV